MIKVKLHSILKIYSPEKQNILSIGYQNEMTLEKLMLILEINSSIVGVVLINGKIIKDNTMPINDGDSIELYPIFGGG